MSYTISIPTYEGKGGYIVYTFRVKSTPAEGTWSFQRRYSVLRENYDNLRRVVRITLPSFPPKKFFGNMQDVFLQSRRAGLEQFYRTVAAFSEVRDTAAFKAFIRPKDLVIEEAPVSPPPSLPVTDAPQVKPAVHLTRELEKRLNRIADQAINLFINMADLPTPLETEDIRRKQKEYSRMIAALKVEWRVVPLKSEAVQAGQLGRGKKWMEDKSRELEAAVDAVQVVSEAVVLAA